MIARRLQYLALLIACGALIAGYALRGIWPGCVLVGAIGLIWVLGLVLRWQWISSTMFLVLSILSGLVLLVNAPSYLEVIAITAALIAWDLSYFIGRLEKARTAEIARMLEANHLRRLALITVAGLVLMGAAILLRIQLGFAGAFILGGLALAALLQVVARLGYQRERPRPGQPPK